MSASAAKSTTGRGAGAGERFVAFLLAAAAIVFAGGCEAGREMSPATSRPASGQALSPPWEECEEGIKLTLSTDLLFEPGSAQLKERGAKAIREPAAVIAAKYPDNVIRVYGFVGNVRGSREMGQEQWRNLSWMRAAAVADVLRTAGIHGDNIEPVGMGRFRPLTQPGATQAANRRIEILIIARRLTTH